MRPESLRALDRANPRTRPDFEVFVDAGSEMVRARLASQPVPEARRVAVAPRGRPARLSPVGVTLAVVVAFAVAVATIGATRSGPGIDDAVAAVRKAASVSAASARRSGTAVVRIRKNGELWAGATVRWHGRDLAVSSVAPSRPGRAGGDLLVVGGTMYAYDPQEGGWAVLGSPSSVDPGSGTLPADYLTSVREDVGGATLRRTSEAMADPTTRRLADGAVVYSGSIAAAVIVRESGLKEGRTIRMLPFGYVAHGEAANPGAALDAAVTVDPDGVVREIDVRWREGAAAWTYTVSYSRLGDTPRLVAPADAKPLDRTPA